MKNALERLEFPELFIGIVSPVGVDTTETITSISKYFASKEYKVINIKVTDLFEGIKSAIGIDLPLDRTGTEERIKSYINFGNEVRRLFKDDSVLAAYTIFNIQRARRRHIRQTGKISYQGRVYILHQFKRKEEIDLLRAVYGQLFIQVSIYQQRSSRLEYLSHKLAHEKNSADQSDYRPTAHELVATDENEKKNAHGQRLTKVFHEADFIVDGDDISRNGVDNQVTRFFELLFSSNSISPSKQEYGMFAAKAAALRTLDLSRQVGAAIFRPSGEIISLGSNEVPKAGGGTYWCDEPPFDAREYTRKEDSNDARKRELLAEIYDASGSRLTFDEFLAQDAIEESQFMDALEYGRIVHAEMSAISDAARLGLSLQDAVLFCTTFPCHMCAKHIVASGIKRVIFLEPYPKSLAADLHTDAIRIQGYPRGRFSDYGEVVFEHFHGVTPRRYRELFERGSRKVKGKFVEFIKGKARPNIDLIAPSYTAFEDAVIREGMKSLKNLKTADLKSKDFGGRHAGTLTDPSAA